MTKTPTPDTRPSRVLPRWTIAACALAVAAAIGLSLWWLLSEARQGPIDRATLRIDAIKTALSVGAGTGGAIALIIAIRRQQLSEHAQTHREDTARDDKQHRERVAEVTERDATERRVTDLYTKAVDQLGSDKAPVRLGGLYALERLAQDNPEHRQTIVSVICAYLRMPYTPPADDLPGAASETSPHDTTTPQSVAPAAREELQVRLTAQRILAHHLRPGDDEKPAETFWPNIDLDLTGAALHDLDMSGCKVVTGRFGKATFSGYVTFGKATFSGHVTFGKAVFSGHALFGKAVFSGHAWFDAAKFSHDVWFDAAKFGGHASFDAARFSRDAWFERATFSDDVRFERATFGRHALFNKTTFNDVTWFGGATFSQDVQFNEARVSAILGLPDSRILDIRRDHVTPPGWRVEPDTKNPPKGRFVHETATTHQGDTSTPDNEPDREDPTT